MAGGQGQDGAKSVRAGTDAGNREAAAMSADDHDRVMRIIAARCPELTEADLAQLATPDPMTGCPRQSVSKSST